MAGCREEGERLMQKTLVPLAHGAEEMETVIVVDVLRRAGWKVVLAGFDEPGAPVTASRGVKILPDARWSDIQPDSFDLLVLPGGAGGTDVLCTDNSVLSTVRSFVEAGRIVGAICAAPLVLQAAGVLSGRRATCHPAVSDKLTATARIDEPVVIDDRIITSQGPGTAFEFALALLALAEGEDLASSVRSGLVL